MNQKQMKEFMKALNAIAEEKKIDKSIVVEAMEQAMAAAYKKNEGLTNVMAKVDDVTGDIRIYSYKTVVETVENPDLEISLEDASKEVEGIELGDTIKDKELPLKDFGRVAAQTAKQIVVQRVKEAEKKIIVIDNFERALNVDATSNDIESYQKGMTMIYNSLKNILEKFEEREITSISKEEFELCKKFEYFFFLK